MITQEQFPSVLNSRSWKTMVHMLSSAHGSFWDTELYWNIATLIPLHSPVAIFRLQRPALVVKTRIEWLIQPKIFIIWSFAEQVCQSLN